MASKPSRVFSSIASVVNALSLSPSLGRALDDIECVREGDGVCEGLDEDVVVDVGEGVCVEDVGDGGVTKKSSSFFTTC